MFEVGRFENRFVVDVVQRLCTCREWNITGIPCLHALAAIHYMGRDPAKYVHEYYAVRKCLKGYEHGLQPINGEKLWPEVDDFTVKPPAIKRQVGRPKNKRIRSACEKEPINPNKLSRHGMVMNCTKCGGTGHNKKKCQNMTLPKPPPKPKGKPGRPVKQPHVASQTTTTETSGASTSGGRGRDVATTSASARRGRGGRGRRGATSFQVPRSATFQAPRSASGGAAHLIRERNFARGGGLYTSAATRNIYYSAPGFNVVHSIYNTRSINDGGSTSGQQSNAHQSGASSQQSMIGGGSAI